MQVAGRYRLVELLGRGAMGEVWRAEDTTLGRDVAVKLLLEGVAVDHAAERFRLEAQTAARLNHPNVVAVYDFDEENRRGYLVMELVPGQSLRDELAARGALGADPACRIAGQAAAGLAAAHARGVVHRDIKPGNLLLAADGTVKVADFGIARAVADSASSLTTTGAVLGTSAYLAPERGVGQPAGPASDVYALGCVLYEMLCGQPPFSGDPAAVVYQHIDAAPQRPDALRPDVSGALADFVLRMLAKDPSARPSAAQIAHALTEESELTRHPVPGSTAQEDTTSRFTLPLATSPEHRRSRRPGAFVSGAMVLVFLIACVVGFQLVSGQNDEAEPPPATPSSTSDATPPSDEEGDSEEFLDDKEARKAAEEERKQREKEAKEAEKEAREAAEEERKRQEEAAKEEADEEKDQDN